HEPGAERTRAWLDAEQVHESEQGGQQSSDDADADEPVGPFGEDVLAVAGERDDVEDETGDPCADGDGDEDRVERVAVRTREWVAGTLGPVECGFGHRGTSGQGRPMATLLPPVGRHSRPFRTTSRAKPRNCGGQPSANR